MRESSMRRWWPRLALAAAGLVLLALLVMQVVAFLDLLDPDRGARDLAVQDIRADAELDFGRVYDDWSPCYQRRNLRADFLREQEQLAQTRLRAPADSRYEVVSVRSEGVYRRVEVRVTIPIPTPFSYDEEVDVQRYQGRWVKDGLGVPGQAFDDPCTGRVVR